MKSSKKHLLLLTLLALIFYSHSSRAVNIQQFTRSNTLTFEMLEDARMKNSHVHNDYDFIFTLGGSYVDSPLVTKDDPNSQQFETLIPEMYGFHYGAGYYLKPWLQIGLTGNYSFFTTNHDEKRSGFGDIEVKAKVRLINQTRYAFSIAPLIVIPTGAGKFTPRDGNGAARFGGEAPFLSDDSFGFGFRGIFEYLFKRAQVVANLGYRYSKNAVFERIDMDQQVYTGLGVYIPWHKTWGSNFEWARLWTLPLGTDDINPNEIYAGISGGLTKHIHFFAGAGFGNPFDSTDGNDFRISAGIKVLNRIKTEEKKPLKFTKLEEVPEPVETPPAPAPKKIACTPFIFGNSNTAVVRFKHDYSDLSNPDNPALMEVAERLKANRANIKLLEVQGHTSRVGSDRYNTLLGANRAIEVANFLIKEAGLTKNQFRILSYGESKPVVDEKSIQAERSNRRVEFKVSLKNPCR